ncbi:MAG: hypothetical protein CMM46_03330 [Rhodospirillaceae bacterium]|nr:hypothetical protein [Rhodospirillaceae bacterium]
MGELSTSAVSEAGQSEQLSIMWLACSWLLFDLPDDAAQRVSKLLSEVGAGFDKIVGNCVSSVAPCDVAEIDQSLSHCVSCASTCSSMKAFMDSGREMFIVLMARR